MPRYIFDTIVDDDENLALYDAMGGGQILYLLNIVKDVEKLPLMDYSGTYQQVIVQLFIHEDIHQGITEIGEVDTMGDQDHVIMDSLSEYLY